MLDVIVIIIVVKLHHELCLQHKDEVFVTSNQEGINKVLKMTGSSLAWPMAIALDQVAPTRGGAGLPAPILRRRHRDAGVAAARDGGWAPREPIPDNGKDQPHHAVLVQPGEPGPQHPGVPGRRWRQPGGGRG